MKLTLAFLLFATTANAGNLLFEAPQETVVVSDKPMGGSTNGWIVGFGLLGLVAIAVKSTPSEPVCKTDCEPDDFTSKKDRLDALYQSHDWRNYDPVQRQCVIIFYRVNGAGGDWSTYQVCT